MDHTNLRRAVAAASLVVLGSQAAFAMVTLPMPPLTPSKPTIIDQRVPNVPMPKFDPPRPLPPTLPKLDPSRSRPFPFDQPRSLPSPVLAQAKPDVSIKPGQAFGVAPTVNLPLRNGVQVEIKGPDMHPQVPPSLNGGGLSVTVPMPERKK